MPSKENLKTEWVSMYVVIPESLSLRIKHAADEAKQTDRKFLSELLQKAMQDRDKTMKKPVGG